MVAKLQDTNLRGADLSGRDLVGQDFSHFDIRGTSFRKAILVGADFSHAKAGLSRTWTFSLGASSLALALLAGLVSGYSAALLSNLWVGNASGPIFGIFALVALFTFLAVILFLGLGTLLVILTEIVAAILIAIIAFLPTSQANLAVDVQFTALALAGSLAGVGNIAVGIAIARLIPLWKPGIITGGAAFLGLVFGVLLGNIEVIGYLISSSVALATIVTGGYIGWLAITAKNNKYQIIQSLATALVTKGGTSFHGANLTDANFTEATLKSTDFRQATLTRTNWFHARKLDQARTDGTYLESSKVHQLAITKLGRGENFDRCDLRGLNLQEAILTDASFVGADLSEANLQEADLSRAKLVQAQLYRTDLSKACLTGTFIQDWAISTDTCLTRARCEYIYMRLPTADDPDPWRKPDNRQENFKEGDFADFISPIIKTLDLYKSQNVDMREVASQFKTLDLFHHGGLDPSAAAIAIQRLAENHPEAELELLTLEGRGHEKIRLQAKVSSDANQSELHREYFKTYSQIKSLPINDLQALLAGMGEKDERIRSLEKLLENALGQPKFYVETYTRGDYIMSQSKGNVSISGVQGNVSGVAAAGENQTMTGVALGAISGSVTNTINQLPESSDPDQPSLKDLLAQLQAAIETEPELTEEDKIEALEQVENLAQAGQQPGDGALQKAAKTSIKILKGTVSTLPDMTKLVQECTKLLPAIAALLAFI
ncbi:pentapeptide repeat-containing protein [Leptolyngbya sp. FACHB-261]|uniref:pentapeptide repeat-containing protein n=1 Tax=Leptolyngbya sp. FACHB-261 TaxID=2692806 RepID=UPI00168A1730|nr:pentapeptide repeat-containing protein [Leptolyngbya sp. FACHB-261]MBD2100102.1 pentapeptide repeat-containing protein [Leptolyngbya sp. FACHB-261]